jgi:hypothetical protein
MKLGNIMEVFKAGKMVVNPTFWKQKTIDLNTLVVVISGIVGIINFFDCSWCNLNLTTEQVVGIATGIVSLVGVFNAGSTAATSEKVGAVNPKITAIFKKKPVVQEVVEEVTEEEVGEEVSSELSDDISKLQ